jgi:aryl-alcohol dehydrogenase-like predicted oxidoreductase
VDNVVLGRSGLKVSPISFGTWQLGSALNDERATATIERARELGVNFFDTAPGFDSRATEQLLGDALDKEIREDRDRLVFAAEGGLRRERDVLIRDASPDALREGVDESLNALRIDAIDLYQVLWPDPRTPFEAIAKTLDELIESGKVLHAGVSLFGTDPTENIFQRGPLETLQTSYHLFRRANGGLWLPYARLHDIGVLIGGPLAEGSLAAEMGPFAVSSARDWDILASAFGGDASGPQRRVGMWMRRPAKGGTTRPLTSRPAYGFGRPHRPNPDRGLHRRIINGLQQFAAEREISLPELSVAWTLANPAVDVVIVGASSPDDLQGILGATDVQLSRDDLAEIERILRSADRDH